MPWFQAENPPTSLQVQPLRGDPCTHDFATDAVEIPEEHTLCVKMARRSRALVEVEAPEA